MNDPNRSPKKEGPRYLIGPDYYPVWERLLRWILLCAVPVLAALTLLSTLATGLIRTDLTVSLAISAVTTAVAEAISTGVSVALGGFTVLTLLFAYLEYRGKPLPEGLTKVPPFPPKDPKKAPKAPEPAEPTSVPEAQVDPKRAAKAKISRSDATVGLAVQGFFFVLLLVVPRLLISLVIADSAGGSLQTVSILNPEATHRLLPWILAGLAAGMASDLYDLIRGVWCRAVLLCHVLCTTVQAVAAVVLLKLLPLWNPAFEAYLAARACPSFLPFCLTADLLASLLLALLLISSFGSLVGAFYKTARYGVEPDD